MDLSLDFRSERLRFSSVSAAAIVACSPSISSFSVLLQNSFFHPNIIDDEEIARISLNRLSAEMDFQCLAGPRTVSVDLKYDVLCL